MLPAIPQGGLRACFSFGKPNFCHSPSPMMLELWLAVASRDNTSPVVPKLSFFTLANLQRTASQKTLTPWAVHPLENHRSQGNSCSSAKSRSWANSLRLTCPKRTSWLCSTA